MRHLLIGLSLGVLGASAVAGDGLSAPAADEVWPQWQGRVILQTSRSPLLQSPSLWNAAPNATAATGGSVLGDYYFGTQGLKGRFRASGGLLLGSPAAASMGLAAGSSARGSGLALASSLPAVSVLDAAAGRNDADALTAAPYLGLGYSGPIWHSGFSLTADLGVMAERVDGSGRVRGVFGSQSLDGAVRELRFSPVLQLGVRYAF